MEQENSLCKEPGPQRALWGHIHVLPQVPSKQGKAARLPCPPATAKQSLNSSWNWDIKGFHLNLMMRG